MHMFHGCHPVTVDVETNIFVDTNIYPDIYFVSFWVQSDGLYKQEWEIQSGERSTG